MSENSSETEHAGPGKNTGKKGAKTPNKAKSAVHDDVPLTTPYAVIRTGGKQYVVTPGARVIVEKIEANVGDTVELKDVLCVKSSADAPATIGSPVVAGATVKAKVLAQDRAKKVVVYKKKRRTGYTKKQGHRQFRTQLRIESISA